jgi:hypothetical protein
MIKMRKNEIVFSDTKITKPKTAFITSLTWKVIIIVVNIIVIVTGIIILSITIKATTGTSDPIGRLYLFITFGAFLTIIALTVFASYLYFEHFKNDSFKAESTPSDLHYSSRKVMMAFTPMYYLLILVVIAFIYVGNVSRLIEVFIFTILIGIFLILPYLIFPIGCLVLLFWVENFHIFTLNLLGITGDTFTLGITIFIAICYAIVNTIVLSMTVLSIVLVRIDTEKALDLFTTIEKASLTKWSKRFREKYLN